MSNFNKSFIYIVQIKKTIFMKFQHKEYREKDKIDQWILKKEKIKRNNERRIQDLEREDKYYCYCCKDDKCANAAFLNLLAPNIPLIAVGREFQSLVTIIDHNKIQKKSNR